jgi:hypothetical protein
MQEASIEVANAYTLVSDQWQYRSGLFPCRVQTLDVSRGKRQN